MTEPLDPERIAENVNPALRPVLRRVTVLQEVDSTNLELARMPLPEQHAHAVLAEEQTGGRGRRQRSWHSPPGGNIYLSLGWQFRHDHPARSNLPLVSAICVVGALAGAGLDGHGIKWPNDILLNGKKLAGILVELQSTGNGPANAVIGVGLNVRMPRSGQDPGKVIDRPWTDLESNLPRDRKPVDRNRLASMLLDRLMAGLQRFEDSGFESVQPGTRMICCKAGRSGWNTRAGSCQARPAASMRTALCCCSSRTAASGHFIQARSALFYEW